MDTAHIRWDLAAETRAGNAMGDPTMRYAHAAAVFRPDPDQNTPSRIIMYGGVNIEEGTTLRETPRHDVWLMTIHGKSPTASSSATSGEPSVEWKLLRSINPPRGGHKYHTMVAVGSDVYVFGNRSMGTSSEERFHNQSFEIHKFHVDLAKLSVTWEAVKYTSPESIPGRLGLSTVLLADGRILSYGGKNVGKNSTTYYNDLILFNPTTRAVTYHNDDVDKASKRAYFALATNGTRLFLNGGCAPAKDGKNTTIMSKNAIMHIYDVSSVVPPKQARWRDVPYAHVELNAALAARFNHSVAWLDDGRTLLYMGGSDEANMPILSAWAFNVRTHSAVKLEMAGTRLQERANTVLVKVNATTLVCFGGKNLALREGRRRPAKVHTPGVYIGTIRHARAPSVSKAPLPAVIAAAAPAPTARPTEPAPQLSLEPPAAAAPAPTAPPAAPTPPPSLEPTAAAHSDSKTTALPPPPSFIKSVLKRKRSVTDSPETAQKPAKHVEMSKPDGGVAGRREVQVLDDETKDSSEESPQVPPTQPVESFSLQSNSEQNDESPVAIQFERDNERLRDECAHLVAQNDQIQVETLKAKYHHPSLQINLIKNMLETLATALDDQHNHASTSQSTVNSSQDSPSDLLVNADGHPLSPAELQDELDKTMTAMDDAKSRAVASKEAARATAKQAADDEAALHATLEKVSEIRRALSRDTPNNALPHHGSAAVLGTANRPSNAGISTLALPPTTTSPAKAKARTPPITPVSLLKRKRSVTDSPEAPQKTRKRLDASRPGGSVACSSGGSTFDDENKESSEESPPTLLPPPQALEASSLPLDTDVSANPRLLQLQNDNGLLRHKLDRLKAQREERLAEALKAKEQEPSSQLAAIMSILTDLATTRDAHRHFDMNSQSTINSSQDSPFDLVGFGHPMTLAELQWEFDRAVAAANAARRRAAASDRAMTGHAKKADANRDAVFAALDKVTDIWNAMLRDCLEATQEDVTE